MSGWGLKQAGASHPEQRVGKAFRENNLYVKHLPEDCDDDQLLAMFRVSVLWTQRKLSHVDVLPQGTSQTLSGE